MLELIAVAFALYNKEKHRCRYRHYLGSDDGQPYSVQLPDERKQQHRRKLEHKGSQERDQRTGQAVVERGEKRRAEDRKAREQERE